MIHANVALDRENFDHPLMASFIAQVDEVNRLAFSSPGFIKSYSDELVDRNAIYPEPYLMNVTSWNSVESLKNFVYTGIHAAALKNRREWFETQSLPYVLYWLPQGELPTAKQVSEKIQQLADVGPSEIAFNFSKPFTAPEA